MADVIGTVEFLRQRIVPLDAALGHDPLATTVYVEPGTYDVHRTVSDTTYWMLRGRLNLSINRLGDGTTNFQSWDQPGDIEVVFPSKMFGPDEFAEFLAEPGCTEGHAGQRLRFVLDRASV